MAALSVHEPVPASHPDHLWVAATRRGLRPAPPEGARVLEIACGDGSNLLPMAFHRPDARFVGLEGGPAVRAAQDGARRLGLSNVTFVAGDLDAIRARGERYDYVIVHGVLSHVSDAARAATFALAAAVLEPSGVLYVDHLGRSARMVEARLRDLVRRRVGPLPTVAERITAMRAILDALEEVPPTPDRPHAVTARVEVTYARGLSDAALVQHFLTPHRHGIAPSELAALAARHGLAPFDEGWDPSPERHAEQRTEAQLAAVVGPDAADFLELAAGRRTHAVVLCPTTALAAATTVDDVPRGTFAGPLATRLPDVLFSPDIEAAFATRQGAMLRTKDPFNKAVLTELRDAWPKGRSFAALVEAATSRLAEADLPAPAAVAVERQARELLTLHGRGAIEWRSREVLPAVERPERPRVDALTAWQASRSYLLTDAQHRMVVVDELTRRLVALLDGTHDVAALVAEVERWRDAGELQLPKDTAPPALVEEALDGLTKGEILRG